MRKSAQHPGSVFLFLNACLLFAFFTLMEIEPARAQDGGAVGFIGSNSPSQLDLVNSKVSFEPNIGQSGSRFKYIVRTAQFTGFLEDDGIQIRFRQPESEGNMTSSGLH